MAHDNPDTPNVIAPPPIVFFAPLALGIGLNYFAPLSFVPPSLRLVLAALFSAPGMFLGAWALIDFVRHRTSPEPWHPTRALITDGVFRFTRNPIYVAYTLIYVGVALALDSVWALAFLPFVLIVVQRGIIAREEKYLESKFGDEYRAYQARVRRWI